MNPIIEKIRKLLALANGTGAADQERESALRMAHALLAKHNLSMSDTELEPTRTALVWHLARLYRLIGS